jgi:hypothetical protein
VKKTTAFFVLLLIAVLAHAQRTPKTISGLKLIGEIDLPHNMPFNGTTIGGLSGIDYDVAKNQYYLISDDRSAINPARYYTAKILFNAKKLDSVVMLDVTTFLQPNGIPYPDSKTDPAHTPDPEAIRYNPISNNWIWTSEGERIVRGKDTVLENPAITFITAGGKFLDTFPLPKNLYMHATENGPRQNGVLEGASFTNQYQTLFVNVEEPLYEDGPRADLTDNQATIRILKYDVKSKQNTAQYAYVLDKVMYPSVPETAFKINGVPDILAMDDQHLLVMERSFSTGRLPCTIKIFLADLSKATDIKDFSSLTSTTRNPQPATKKLILNLDDLGIYIDNVEGMTFGPDLPNGHKTLIMVADNNFQLFEKTQFFVFEVVE